MYISEEFVQEGFRTLAKKAVTAAKSGAVRAKQNVRRQATVKSEKFQQAQRMRRAGALARKPSKLSQIKERIRTAAAKE